MYGHVYCVSFTELGYQIPISLKQKEALDQKKEALEQKKEALDQNKEALEQKKRP